MPIYEYVCLKCFTKEEVLQKVDEEAPSVCTHCSAQKSLKKVVSHSAFHLKGGGWYKDLYSSSKTDHGSSKSDKSKVATSSTTNDGKDVKKD